MVKFLISFVFLILSLNVYATDFKEGVDYLVSPQPLASKDMPQVVEVFWYGCPHCWHFEPYTSAWRASHPKIKYSFFPAGFNDKWADDSKLYFALEQMGFNEKAHYAIFEAFHVKKINMQDINNIKKVVKEAGVDPEKFIANYNSFIVANKRINLRSETDKLGITGTPTLIVNGKYFVSPSISGGPERALQVVDFLITNNK